MHWDETVVPVLASQVDTSVPPAPSSGLQAEQDILSSLGSDQYNDQEKALVAFYAQTPHGSQGLNSYLRGAPPVSPVIPQYCQKFQELVEKFKLPHAIDVLRGVKDDGFLPPAPAAGITITNYGFTSTSFDPMTPEKFALAEGPVGIGAVKDDGPTSPVILDVHVPPGMPCLPVSALATDPAALAEHELILPDGVKFHVMADFSTPISGVAMRVLKVVALPPTGAAGPPPRAADPGAVQDDPRGVGDSTSMKVHAPEPGDAESAGAALAPEMKTAGWWSDHFKKSPSDDGSSHYDADEERDSSGKWTKGPSHPKFDLDDEEKSDQEADAEADDYEPTTTDDDKSFEEDDGKWADGTRSERLAQEKAVAKAAKKIKVSDLEGSAFTDYQNTWYNQINGVLRGKHKVDMSNLRPDYVAQSMASTMQKVIMRSELQEPVEVLRGSPHAHGISSGSMVGKTITNKGFVSTSFDPKIAEDFSAKADSQLAVLFDIHVPAGVHAFPMLSLSDSRIKDEHELVLPHGSQFKVTGDDYKIVRGHKFRVLHCTAADPSEEDRVVKESAYDPNESRDSSGEWTAGGKGAGEVKDFLDGIGGQDRSPEQIQYALKSFMGLSDEDAKAHAEHYKQPAAPQNPSDTWKADSFNFDDPDMSTVDSIPDEDAIVAPDGTFTDDEQDAISDYVGPGYHDINAALRGQTASNMFIDDDAVKRGIAGMKSALKKYTLPKPVEVMRGMHNDVRLPKGDLTGKVITHKGFTSTSFDPGAVAPFLSSTDPDERPVMFDYHLPAGYHAIPTKGMGLNDDEHELIIGHGTKFKVQAETEQSMDEGTGDAPKRVRVLHMVPVTPTPRKKSDYDPGESRADDGKWTSDSDKPSMGERLKAIVPHEHAGEEIKKDLKGGLDLPIDQVAAVKDYTSADQEHSYKKINLYMRDPKAYKERYGDAPDSLKDHIAALNKAVNSYKLPVDVHVTRGVTNGSGWLPDKVKGKTITNHGFASTSLTEMVGEVFSIGADREDNSKYKPGVVMDIYAPKGFHALPAFAAGSEVGKEDEIILPDQCRFYVADDQTDNGGTRRLRCIAMPPKASKSSSAQRPPTTLREAARESQPRDERGTWTEGGGPSTERDAAKWLSKHYGDYRTSLPSLQSKAVLLYSSPTFAIMNGLLHGKSAADLKSEHGVSDKDIAMAGIASRHLNSAILGAPETEKSLTVFRQMGQADFKKDDVLTEPGFTSTSLINEPRGSVATAEIRLPVGTKALGGLTREMILPQGSQFTVERASRRGERPHYVMLYQVPGTKSIIKNMRSSRFTPLDTRDWTVVGPGLGRCAAQQMTDEFGQRWYVKSPPTDSHARSEVLASELYDLAGIAAVDARLALVDGRLGVASRWVTGASDLLEQIENPEYRAKLVFGFATDAWLGNWDVVGLDYDNIITANGEPVRVDNGGALLYRAMGEEKGDRFSKVAGELDTMRDSSLNEQAATVFGSIEPDELRYSIARVASVDTDSIWRAIMSAGFDPDQADHVRDTVLARRDHILKYMTGESDVDENGALLARTSGLALEQGDRVDATVLGMYWGTGTIDQISTSDYGGTKLFPAYHVTSDDGQNDWFPPIALTKVG